MSGAMKSKKRVPVDGESIPWKSPFAGLKALDIPVRPTPPEKAVPMDQPSVPIRSNRGRVDIIRQTAHRGGKVVTDAAGLSKTSVTLKAVGTHREDLGRSMKFRPKQGRTSKRMLGHRRERTVFSIESIKAGA